MSVSHKNVDTNSLCGASCISLNLERNEKRRDSLQQRNCKKKSWHNVAVMVNYYRFLYWLYTCIAVEISIYS